MWVEREWADCVCACLCSQQQKLKRWKVASHSVVWRLISRGYLASIFRMKVIFALLLFSRYAQLGSEESTCCNRRRWRLSSCEIFKLVLYYSLEKKSLHSQLCIKQWGEKLKCFHISLRRADYCLELRQLVDFERGKRERFREYEKQCRIASGKKSSNNNFMHFSLIHRKRIHRHRRYGSPRAKRPT